MCIVTARVRNIAGTRIFVGGTNGGRRQLTVYENTVDNATRNNCMVVAVPNPESVEFVDFTGFEGFFKELGTHFERVTMSLSYNMMEKSDGSKGRSRSLAVHKVGSFDCSVAKSVMELNNLNPA